jgi:hypothetical protein
MADSKVPYGYGGPVSKPESEAPASPSAARAPRLRPMVAAGFMFVALAVMFGAIYAMRRPVITAQFAGLEQKQIEDLRAGLNTAVRHPKFDSIAEKHASANGHAFWSVMLGQGLLDEVLMARLVSIKSETDSKPDKSWINEGSGLRRDACSLTGPRLGDLKELMSAEQHCVLVTFNARNWNNYPDDGVIVIWSDRNCAEWLTFEEAATEWSITAEEWADPAGKLFGKKTPFQHTYE